jgi:hypothetical protein
MEFSWEENLSFWKNIFLVVIFFTIAPITLGVSLFSLLSLKAIPQEDTPRVSGVRIYASLPGSFPSVSGIAEVGDARVEIVRQYLEDYSSPLEPHAGLLVEASDKYGLDFRLITAIAQQESNLCKIIPPGSFNCWGWGIHSEGTLGFTSFEEGIENVSKGIREEYLNKGFQTVEEIMSKYTPLSNGSWADGVNTFMSGME